MCLTLFSIRSEIVTYTWSSLDIVVVSLAVVEDPFAHDVRKKTKEKNK